MIQVGGVKIRFGAGFGKLGWLKLTFGGVWRNMVIVWGCFV